MSIRDFFRLDDDHPFTGGHMLAVVFLFFGVIVAVNVAMAVVATGTFPGLVVHNSYVASQEYNELLASARAQAETGWRMEIAAPAGIVAVRFLNRQGEQERDLVVTAVAGRPSSTREDRAIDLYPEAGAYRSAEALPPGVWDVFVEAWHDGALAYQERRRVFVRRD